MALKRSQDCSNRLIHLRNTDVSSWRAGLKIIFPVIFPEPKAAVLIYLDLIRDISSAFKRAQDCPNRLSHFRETDVSLMKVGLKTTFPGISPEPEIAATIHLHIACGHFYVIYLFISMSIGPCVYMDNQGGKKPS